MLTTVESSAKAKWDGLTIGMTKRYANNYQFQWNYTLSRDMSDDDNERDPFNFRYARADNLVPEYNYSDRDQRHRFNAWLLVTQKGVEFNTRVSARSAQPKSVGNTPQDRIQPDGSIIKRNTLRKDNEFFTWDIRVARPFKLRDSSVSDRADLRDVQPDQQQEHPSAGSDEPDLQLRRHRPEWPRRSAAGTAGGAGQILEKTLLLVAAGLQPRQNSRPAATL